MRVVSCLSQLTCSFLDVAITQVVCACTLYHRDPLPHCGRYLTIIYSVDTKRSSYQIVKHPTLDRSFSAVVKE